MTRLPMILGRYQLRPWLADTSEACERGLMHTESLPFDGGLLLAYPEPMPLWLWMRNTPMPLSAGFLDASGTIVGTADMDPFDKRRHHSPVPAQYALETHRGWFRARGLGVGCRASFSLTRDPGVRR